MEKLCLIVTFCLPADAAVVPEPGHQGGDSLCLQHRELQTLQGGGGRAHGPGQAEVQPPPGGAVRAPLVCPAPQGGTGAGHEELQGCYSERMD